MTFHCLLVNQEKAYDWVPKEEHDMRKSGVAEKHVIVLQDMYEEWGWITSGIGSKPFFSAAIKDRLTDEVW